MSSLVFAPASAVNWLPVGIRQRCVLGAGERESTGRDRAECAFAPIPEDDERQGDEDPRRDLGHTAHVTPDVDRAGRSPLHYAALEGRAADVAAYLHEHDEVNFADEDGFTPLHFAAQQQHAEVAAVLIEAGANLNARNRFGNTALWGALFNVRSGDGEVVRVLLDAGADPDAENNYGVSARGLASKVANYDLIRFFRA
jgi:uncharacterized protein